MIMLLGWNEALKGAQNKRNRLQKFHYIVAMVVDGPLHQPSWFKSLNTKLRKKNNLKSSFDGFKKAPCLQVGPSISSPSIRLITQFCNRKK